jgi:transaldolase
MKIFIDTANVEEIRRAWSLGVIDGVTTNPTLMCKEQRDPVELLREICSIVEGPVSAEAVSLQYSEMLQEARALARVHPNVVVKIPMTEEGLRAVKSLSQEGIKTNVTLVFSPSQALLAAKAGATFVSPFVGRLDDISHTGMALVADIMQIYENYGFSTQVIVASIRNPLHVVEAAKLGAHVATIPFEVIRKLLKHSLTDLGIERFLQDWQRLRQKCPVYPPRV